MMTDKHVFEIGETVESNMNWNKGELCKIIDVQPEITMNGATLVNQHVQLSYSDDPEDVSGWLSTHDIKPKG